MTLFYSDQFILAKDQLFLCHSFILSWSHLLPDQLPGKHTGLQSHVRQCLPLSAFRTTHLLISHSYLVGRSMVVWHILMVHTCSLICTNHIDMTAHIPAFLTELGTTCIHLEHSTGWHSHISHLWSSAGRIFTHPCINQTCDCLTSVILLYVIKTCIST